MLPPALHRHHSFPGMSLLLGLLTTAWLLPVLPSAHAADRPVDYSRQIRPLLSDLCFKCHGPDEQERKAGLRLDIPADVLKVQASGSAAVVPQQPDASELLARLVSTNPDEVMPPPATGKKMTPAQVELVRRWIAEGASMKAHWAFVPPHPADPPGVANPGFVRNSIDQFVLARLQAEGLEPSPEADKATLLRRVTLDLTGLPPTPAELDAFLADTTPQAYEQAVDRLLQSSRYGEHQARYWLDAARYGDTHGLHLDNERSMWPYRQWVIESFNRNQPFDQFTIEQLAGDLLPEPSLEQRVATGFNRCNVSTSEGGSIDDEVLVRYTVDRVETTSTVFLGLTLGCAVCHDHKYDPFSQREFYQMSAFFNSFAEAAMDGNALGPPPVLKVPQPEQSRRLAELEGQVAAARAKVPALLDAIEYTDPTPNPPEQLEPAEYVWIDDDLPAGAKAQGDSPWEFVNKEQFAVLSGTKASVRTAPGLSQHFFTDATDGLVVGEGDKLFAHVFLDPQNPPKEIMLQWNDGAWEHRATWGADEIAWGAANSPSRLPQGDLPKTGEWVRLEVEAAKVGLNPGAVIRGWAFTQFGGKVYWDKAGIVSKTPQAGAGFDSLAVWERFQRSLTKSSLPGPVLEAVKLPAEQRSPEQQKLVRHHFFEKVCPLTKPKIEPVVQELAALEKQRAEVDGSIPLTMVTAEMPNRRDAFVLVRGQYDKRADKVEAATPSALPPMAPDLPRNRLGLARWLVDPAHPLTARVTVNRFWQQLFGTGLVKTAEDFGAQGQWPSHPELLDWLAVDFRTHGWDVKRFLKQVVMSGTYRQSSRVSPQLLQRDPANELLARGPRFRLDGEVLRDSALFTSGLLVERLGGRSVKPNQPEGLWEAVAFVGSTTQNFRPDPGEAQFRRSMYTFWKRTSPPPVLLTFDAPSRENCTVRRARTNTPLQALVLLNERQFVEAARRFAQRALKEAGPTPEDRARFLFRWATARLPTDRELAVVLGVFQAELQEFQQDPEAAHKLLQVGETPEPPGPQSVELAAWTMVANLVLNLDEAVTKE